MSWANPENKICMCLDIVWPSVWNHIDKIEHLKMKYKRSINFQKSITLSTAWTWDAEVSYPGSLVEPTYYDGWDIVKLREHIFNNHPEFIEE